MNKDKTKYPAPLDISKLTEEELILELEKGYDAMVAGKVTSVDEVFDEILNGFENE